MTENAYTYTDSPASSPSGGRPDFDWRASVDVLLARGWIAVTVFVVAVVAGLIYTQRQIPLYRSTARLLVDEEIPKVLNVQDVFAMNARNLEYFNTHLKALHSRTMVAAALKASGLDHDPRLVSPARGGADPVEVAMNGLTIEPETGSRIIDVVVEHRDPAVASTLANAIADQYIQINLDQRMSSSLDAFEWLRRQAEDYRQRIEKGQLALHDYRKSSNDVSLEEHQDTVIAKLKSLSAELTAAETQRLVAEGDWNSVARIQAAGQPIGNLPSIAADDLVKQAQGTYVKRLDDLEGLRARYHEKHPRMVQALSELDAAEQLYRGTCQIAAARLRSLYEQALERENRLRQALKEQEKEALSLDLKLVKYTEMRRNVEADQQIHAALLARMQETKMASDLKTSNVRLVDHAVPSPSPFYPSKLRNLFNSMLIGLCLGLALSWAAHFVDDRIRRPEDVEHSLRCPLLAVVPTVRTGNPAHRARIVERDLHSPSAEAFRTLRATLALRPESLHAKRLMITSAGASEGKSLVASNLAIALAQDGQATLLIDGDLRRPSVHHVFDADPDAGLSAVLAGHLAWPQAIGTTPLANLHFMNAGRQPPNPSELLGSAVMKQMLDAVAERYDRIVIDCPPVFGVSDPLALLPAMDGIIFVAHFNKTGRRAAAQALDRLKAGKTPILGVILNNVNLNRVGTYYYYRRYGYEGYPSSVPGA
jgi:polysaccharide biosynthesis transport protein